MFKNFSRLFVGTLTLCAFLAGLSGCSSGAMKARKAEREKLASQGKIFCDFVNGELFPDLEVELNLEMVKRCDQDKALTISSYKTPSENVGIMYCCVSQGDKRSEQKSENRSEERSKKEPEIKPPPVTGAPVATPPANNSKTKEKEVEGSN